VASPLDRLYHAMRHPSASAVGTQPDTVSGFEHLRGHKYCLLVTYKRNGDAVPTPVWFGLRDAKVYIRSEGDVAKVKRIRNDPRVRLAPCTVRGRTVGPPAEGLARPIEKGSPDEDVAEAALKANYGLGRKLYERVAGTLVSSLVYIEVTPAGESVPSGESA
jgi:PPOX class probable F420-dependent enzyme